MPLINGQYRDVTLYKLRPGQYKVTVWVGDKENLHGKLETYRIKGLKDAREKVKTLKKIHGIT